MNDIDSDNTNNEILSWFFFIIFFVYFAFSVKYIMSTLCYQAKKFMTYWIDFILLFTVILIYSLTESINYNTLNNDYQKEVNLLLLVIAVISSSHFIVNVINAVCLLYQMHSLKKVDLKSVITEEFILITNRIDPTKLYNNCTHFTIYIISFSISLCVHTFFGYSSEKDNLLFKYSDKNNYYIIGLIVFEFIVIKILSSRYNHFVSENYFCSSMINEKIFNKTKKKLFVMTEHLLYKAIFDVIPNIPFLFVFISPETKNSYFLPLKYFMFYLSMIFFGSLILTIDSKNNVAIPRGMFYLYFLPCFKYQFNTKQNDEGIFKPIKVNLNSLQNNLTLDESNMLFSVKDQVSNTNTNTNTNNQNNPNVSVSSNAISNSSSSKDELIRLRRDTIKDIFKNEKEYLPCNFYVVFKIMYLFYKSNEKVFSNVEKSVEDEGIPFRKNFQPINLNATTSNTNRKSFFTFSSDNIKDNLNRINRISITNKEKLLSTKKFSLEQLMNSINDKVIKEDFIKYIIEGDSKKKSRQKVNSIKQKNIYLNNLPSYNQTEFKIESLFNDVLFELFPYYQISINDVLTSLDVNNNKGLFKVFFEKKINDRKFNEYYTKDSFLSFEIYDSDFLPFKKIKEFVYGYRNYLMETITNFSYSFLPLIIGIFNITYLNYNKVIIIYRNPLSFAPLVSFHCWINFCFTENSDNNNFSTSTKNNDVVDINEIEVKNNIKLEEEEYQETLSILKSDMKFLKKMGYELNCKLHLFIVNDVNKNESSIMTNNKSTGNVLNNIIEDSKNENNDDKFINLLRDTNLFKDNMVSNLKKAKKYYGSDVVSLLEKLYFNTVVDNKYMFKIYFSELFRKKIKVNRNTEYSGSENNMNINSGGRFTSYKNDTSGVNTNEADLKAMNKKFCKK